ncbi:Nucleoside diphosphate kinase family protein, partial [Reticulomyxa filosa]
KKKKNTKKKKKKKKRVELSVLLIKPHVIQVFPNAVDEICLRLIYEKYCVSDIIKIEIPDMTYISKLLAKQRDHKYYQTWCHNLWKSRLPLIAVKVYRVNAIAHLKYLCGPVDPVHAKQMHTNTLRAQFGVDIIQNAVPISFERERVYLLLYQFFLNFFFFFFFCNFNEKCSKWSWSCKKKKKKKKGEKPNLLIKLKNNHNNRGEMDYALLLVKPSAAQEHQHTIRAHLIAHGYDVVACKILTLQPHEFKSMIVDVSADKMPQALKYVTSGPVIFIIVSKVSLSFFVLLHCVHVRCVCFCFSNGYYHLSQLIGPRIPDPSKPFTLRSIFGTDELHNALEATFDKKSFVHNIKIALSSEEISCLPEPVRELLVDPIPQSNFSHDSLKKLIFFFFFSSTI